MTLVAWYPLDVDYKDISKNMLDAVDSNIALVTGKVDNAADFDGSTSELDISGSMTFGTVGSVSLWIKVDSTPAGYEYMIGFNDGSLNNRLWIHTHALNQILVRLGTAGEFNTGETYTQGTWAHIVLTFDGTTAKIYKDTVQIGGDYTFSSTINPTILDIGHRASGNHFDGKLDNIQFFNRVLTSVEIATIFSGTEYVIDGYSYFPEFIDGEIIQTALYRIRHARLELADDSSDTITNRLDNSQHVYIYNNYSLVFSGKIENFNFNESKAIKIDIQDFSVHLAEDFITYAASAETASDIVTSILAAHGDGIFTTNITPSSRTYTKTWRGLSPLEIIQELALNEGYTFFVTQFKVFNFVPQNFDDLGVTLTDGDTLFKRSFPHDTTKLKNNIVIIGKGATDTAGIKVIARDPASIEKHGKRTLRIEDTSIDTEDAAIEKAESELNRLANPLVIGNVLVARTFTYTAGSIIQITLPQRSWVAKNFLIIESLHELETPLTELTLGEINILNADQLADVLMKQRLTSKNWEDDATPLTSIERWVEEITVQCLVDIERQTTISRDWNESDWNGNDEWDAAPGAWLTIQSDVKMVITTVGLNRIRDLIVGKAVTDLSAANANVALGEGTTPGNLADTALGNETQRGIMDSGFPRDGTSDGEDEFQTSWDDGDFSSGTFSEIGLLDNTVAGALIARVVPPSTFSKGAGENLRARPKLKLVQ